MLEELTQTRPTGLGQLSQIVRPYQMISPEQIEDFLSRHTLLLPLLRETYSAIERYFGEGQPVTLQVRPGYEADEPALLFAFVQATQAPLTALEQMRRFEEEWWLDASEKTGCLFQISVQFA